MAGTSRPDDISTRRARIAELARQMPDRALTNLAHHIDERWLFAAFRCTRMDGAPGVDGQTARDYVADLRGNLGSLLDRAKSGTYRAPPVKRVHIPKGGGTATRPIGIPTFEDKVLQRAVLMALEPVYEEDFYDFSYGFRPGRSAHQALEHFRKEMMAIGGGWVLEVDIKSYFDSLEHSKLKELLRQRVGDGVLLRLINKWLHAGVMEEGRVLRPESGTPQGGVISPLLANIYLHEALDKWFVDDVLPRLRGRGFLVRYADDFVIGFAREEDARRVWAVLGKRLGRFGLSLHPEKTRLVRFERPPRRPGAGTEPENGTFDLLGFTHLWARSREGWPVIKRKTASSRFHRALTAINQWCRSARHLAIGEQHRTLSAKLNGHYGYYGITGNSQALGQFRWWVWRMWRKWLLRRSQRARRGRRRIYDLLTGLYRLPPARAVHSALRVRSEPVT